MNHSKKTRVSMKRDITKQTIVDLRINDDYRIIGNDTLKDLESEN